jgi:hypothetical protein
MKRFTALALLASALFAQAAIAENGCNGRVTASLTLPNGDVILGGEFTECNGAEFNHVVRYSPSQNRWFPLGSRGRGLRPATVQVNAMTLYQGQVVIGGENIAWAGDKRVKNIAMWNPATDLWSAFTGTDGAPLNFAQNIRDFAVSANTLYVGGQATIIGGVNAPIGVGKFDGSVWSAVGTVSGTSTSGVDSLQLFNGSLYATGLTFPQNFLRLQGSEWQAVGPGFQRFQSARANMTVYQNQLIVSGANGTCLTPDCLTLNDNLRGLALFNGTTLVPINTGLDGAPRLRLGPVNDVLATSTTLYVLFFGGSLLDWNVNGPATASIAGTLGVNTTWFIPGEIPGATVLGQTNGGLLAGCTGGGSFDGRTATQSGTDIYVGGAFLQAGSMDCNLPPTLPPGVPTRRVARLTPTGWQAVAGSSDSDFIFGDGLDE